MEDSEKHCSLCKHYWTGNLQMYCCKLQKGITAKKKPCKYFEVNTKRSYLISKEDE